MGLPLLGIIPLMEEDSKVIDTESKSSILEPYRSLRTNIRYTNVGTQKRSLLITSAIQGDGKTTKVCNLAISFAMEGKRVMVIDGDLRRASLHKIMGVPKEMGLSEYLTGQATLADISKTVFQGMITVITSGKRPPNPAEILGSPRFVDIIREGFESHDIVLVDSPALVPVSDALLLAPHVDSTIIIARAHKTPLKAMLFTKNSLVRAGANIIGIIFNGIEQRKGYYPYYYHYYSYYSYYKSKYYYYEDDDEMDKLPKNFREFVSFSLKNMWIESREYVRIIRERAIKMVDSIGFISRNRKKLLASFIIMLWLVIGFMIYRTIFQRRISEGVSTGNFRYIPYTISGHNDKDNSSVSNVPDSPKLSQLDTVKVEEEINRQMEEWIASWQARDLFRFQKCYSLQGFQYKYGGFNEWVAYKDSLFKADTSSIVKMDSLKVTALSQSEATVLFRQEYAPDPLTLPVIMTKEIKLQREGENWKITREGRAE